jgi:aryl-alcohol dehydrogenase-like predicted oxidoreductase
VPGQDAKAPTVVPLTSRRPAGVAERHGATPCRVALARLLDRSPNPVRIPGTSSTGRPEQNFGATALR